MKCVEEFTSNVATAGDFTTIPCCVNVMLKNQLGE